MFEKEFPPVPIVEKNIPEFYAAATDIFHVYHLYLTQNVNSNKKSLGFCLLKTQPNLTFRNFNIL